MDFKKHMEKIFNTIDPECTQLSESVRGELIEALTTKVDNSVKERVKKVKATFKEAYENRAKEIIKEKVQENNEACKKIIKERVLAEKAKITANAKQTIKESEIKIKTTMLEAVGIEFEKERKKLAESFDQKLTQFKEADIIKLEEKVATTVGKFVEGMLEDVKPETAIVNEAKLKQYESSFDQLKKFMCLTEASINDDIQSAIKSADSEISSLKKEKDQLIAEKIELRNKLKKVEAIELLESKIKGLAPKKRAFLKQMFNESTVTEIEEKFEEAVTAFDVTEKDRRERLIESRKAKADKVTHSKPLTESIKNDITDEMDIFVDIVNKTK